MTELTDKVSVIAQYVFAIMSANTTELGLTDVWYGDQDKIPRSPAACVEAGTKSRELNGAPRRTRVVVEVYIILYHERAADSQDTQRASEDLTERVEDFLHKDPQMGGLVIDSLVAAAEPGTVVRGGAQVKASRLTLQCTSQKMLPYSA